MRRRKIISNFIISSFHRGSIETVEKGDRLRIFVSILVSILINIGVDLSNYLTSRFDVDIVIHLTDFDDGGNIEARTPVDVSIYSNCDLDP